MNSMYYNMYSVFMNTNYRKRRNFCWGLIFVGKLPYENFNPRKFVDAKN